jgi:hypothetical protein
MLHWDRSDCGGREVTEDRACSFVHDMFSSFSGACKYNFAPMRGARAGRITSGGVVMSMEIHALSDRQLNSIADWQKAIDTENFTLQLSTATGTLKLRKWGQRCG